MNRPELGPYAAKIAAREEARRKTLSKKKKCWVFNRQLGLWEECSQLEMDRALRQGRSVQKSIGKPKIIPPVIVDRCHFCGRENCRAASGICLFNQGT